ncbi:GFA family protein [Vibrio marisflavi]|uniref:CENP-V/GFA domain-containing protein n=1 Tax=Vibrio marisflavi CECT 7928 TaxID=634439 RepID=A0ABM9A036_9VIBR|nr:GFA family protein [Vibrio marisflavi]CAH0536611.1 hypothetical protein VMF7928_00566 [Vibrio marisflavi CECT 7928]
MEKKFEGSCHCGDVQFTFVSDLSRVGKCNCSLCLKRNAIMAYTEAHKFTLISGEDRLSCYQFNTMQAKHYFCSSCGIYTHHKPRTQKATTAVNLSCLKTTEEELSGLTIQKISGSELSIES